MTISIKLTVLTLLLLFVFAFSIGQPGTFAMNQKGPEVSTNQSFETMNDEVDPTECEPGFCPIFPGGPCEECDTQIPLDGGILLLLIGGVAIGARKIFSGNLFKK